MKLNFQSVKKMEISAREKKGREKSQKLKNFSCETQSVPVKKIVKIAKNVFHGLFSFSRKKNSLCVCSGVSEPKSCFKLAKIQAASSLDVGGHHEVVQHVKTLRV